MNKKYLYIGLFPLLFTSCNLGIFTATKGNCVEYRKGTDLQNGIFDETTGVGYFRASRALSYDYILLAWEKKDATSHYEIERAYLGFDEDAVPNWERLIETPKGDKTTFKDEKATEDGWYIYRMRAVSLYNRNIKSEYSTTYKGSLLKKIVSANASKGTSTDEIALEFSPIAGAQGYLIYRTENSTPQDKDYIGEVVQPINLQSPVSYRYKVSENEKGKILNFFIKVKGYGNSLEDTKTSDGFSGYTFKEGAPAAPGGLTVSKGSSKDSISVSFHKSANKNDMYKIYRSQPGVGEIVVYDQSVDGQLDVSSEGGIDYYTFIDTAVDEGVEYTYSVFAENSKGTGPSAVDSGYVLSPPTSISFKPVTVGDEFGFNVDYKKPVGFDDENNNFVIVAKKIYENGTSLEEEFETDGQKEFFKFALVPTDSDYNSEIRSIQLKTINKANNVETEYTAPKKISGIPSISDVKCYSNVYESGMKSKKGCYPIPISWTNSDVQPDEIVIKRETFREKVGNPNVFELVGSDTTKRIDIKRTQENQNIDVSRYFDDEADFPFSQLKTVYQYSITPKRNGKEGVTIITKQVYPALTPEYAYLMFMTFVQKPFEHYNMVDEITGKKPLDEYKKGGTKGGIVSKTSNHSTDALGEVTVTDNYKGAKLTYSASMSGLGAAVTFTYGKGFGECSYMYLSSNWVYAMSSNASGNGSVEVKPAAKVDGFFPMTADYRKSAISNYAASGLYTVTMKYNDFSSGQLYESAPKDVKVVGESTNDRSGV